MGLEHIGLVGNALATLAVINMYSGGGEPGQWLLP